MQQKKRHKVKESIETAFKKKKFKRSLKQKEYDTNNMIDSMFVTLLRSGVNL